MKDKYLKLNPNTTGSTHLHIYVEHRKKCDRLEGGMYAIVELANKSEMGNWQISIYSIKSYLVLPMARANKKVIEDYTLPKEREEAIIAEFLKSYAKQGATLAEQ